MQKNEIKPVSITWHINELQMNQRPKPETLKLLEENTRSTLHDVGVEKDFLKKTQEFRSTIDKWDFIKQTTTAKPFAQIKINSPVKRKLTELERIIIKIHLTED